MSDIPCSEEKPCLACQWEIELENAARAKAIVDRVVKAALEAGARQ